MPLGLSLSENGATQHEVRNGYGESPSNERTSRLDQLKTCPNEGTNVHLNNAPRGTYNQKGSMLSETPKENPKAPAKEANNAGGYKMTDCIDKGLMSAAARLPATRRSPGEVSSDALSAAKLPAHFVKNAYSQGFVVATTEYPSAQPGSILQASTGDLLEVWHEESNGWCYGTHVTTRKTVEGCFKKEWTRSVQIETNGNEHRPGNEKMLRKLWQRRIQQGQNAYETNPHLSSQSNKGKESMGKSSMEDELIREEEAAALRAAKKKSKKKGKAKAAKGETPESASIVGSEDVQEEENEAEEEIEELAIAPEPEQQEHEVSKQEQEVSNVVEADQEDGWESRRSKKAKKKGRKEKLVEEEAEKKLSEILEKPEAAKDVPQKGDEDASIDAKKEEEATLLGVEARTEDTVPKQEQASVARTEDASPSLSAVRWADLSDDDDDVSFLDSYHSKLAESETPETETPSEPPEEASQLDSHRSSQDDNVPKESPRSNEVDSEESSEWQDVATRCKKKKSSNSRIGKWGKEQWDEWELSKMKKECSMERWEDWDRSQTGSNEWKETQGSKGNRANQKGGTQHPKKDAVLI